MGDLSLRLLRVEVADNKVRVLAPPLLPLSVFELTTSDPDKTSRGHRENPRPDEPVGGGAARPSYRLPWSSAPRSRRTSVLKRETKNARAHRFDRGREIVPTSVPVIPVRDTSHRGHIFCIILDVGTRRASTDRVDIRHHPIGHQPCHWALATFWFQAAPS